MNPNVHSIVVVTSRALLGLLLVSGMTGCMAPKSYVDPQFRGASYLSLEQRAAPRAIKLEVVFQTNGKENRQLHQRVRSVVSKVLLNTRLFVEAGPAPSIGPDHLHLVINNVGNIGSAVGQGIATGLTLGRVGA